MKKLQKSGPDYQVFYFHFLSDSSINVKLVSGMDASIIIDGTEYCPGKQGINIVSLDFVNFKYSKGLVLQPEKFANYLHDNHFGSLKKWDPAFLVTQGDCTLFPDQGKALYFNFNQEF